MPSPAGFQEKREYGEVTATAIDDEVRNIVHSAFDRTVALLKERREILELAARKLLEKETLNERELLDLVGTQATAPDQQAPAAAGTD